tara:strand:- start:1735 stop:2205 length:471 start_codon:yes stop_codon:yes gene_type:complete
MKRKGLKQALEDILIRLDVPTKRNTSLHIEEVVNKYLPIKVKTPKLKKHTYLGKIKLTDAEELLEFMEEKEDWLSGCDMPSFSFDKGNTPEAEEGEEMFIKINDDLYSFTIHEGECIGAYWDGSIYRTEIRNVVLIPKEEVENYNLIKHKNYGYDY